MNHASLFSGEGGFDLAAEWMGWGNAFHCEINPFCQRILKYYWPRAVSYENIITTNFNVWRGKIDVLTGGFPCQPYSLAGNQLGTEDERHLWPEMLRAIREIQPRYIVGENVPGLINWNGGMVFDQVQTDLETAFQEGDAARSLNGEGYSCIPFVLPVAGINGPHLRYRVFFIAYKNTNGIRWNGEKGQNESNIREFGELGTGNHEWVQTNHGKIVANTGGIPGRRGSEWNDSKRPVSSQNGANIFGEFKNDGGEWIAPHSVGIQAGGTITGDNGEGGGIQEKQRSENGAIVFGGGGSKTITHANSNERSEGWRDTDGSNKAGRYIGVFDAWDSWNGWRNFPTQSPLCGGNDGISRELDRITIPTGNGRRTLNAQKSFTKWREQSLTAHGNAVSPPLILQIFRAIEQFDLLLKTL